MFKLESLSQTELDILKWIRTEAESRRSARVGGSVTKKSGPHRSKNWRVERDIYSVRERDERSWKSHRRTQYRAQSMGRGQDAEFVLHLTYH